jgi:hypothetical protein
VSGTISGGGSRNITVGIERGNVATPGAYSAYYLFDTDGDTATVEAELPVTFIIPGETQPGETEEDVSGPMIVEALLADTWAHSGTQSSSGVIFDYSISVLPGTNYVYAWSDEDENGLLSSGDWYGDAPYVDVEPGERVANVDFNLSVVTSVEDVAAKLPEGLGLEMIGSGR